MATQLPPNVLAALQSQRVTPEQAAILGQYLGVDASRGLGDTQGQQFSGLDAAMYLSRRGAAEGGSANSRQRFQDLTAPFRGQQAQVRRRDVADSEGGSQAYWEVLNPITGNWDRSTNQISNPLNYGEGSEAYRPERPDAALNSAFDVRSGGILGGITGTDNQSLMPGTTYRVNPDGTVALDDVFGATPQNHITGQENLAGVLTVLAAGAAGYYGGGGVGGGEAAGGSAGGGGGGLNFSTGFTDAGTAGGALDSGYAGVAGGGGYGPNFSGGYTDGGTAGGALDPGYGAANSGIAYTGSPSATSMPPAGAAGGGGSGAGSAGTGGTTGTTGAGGAGAGGAGAAGGGGGSGSSGLLGQAGEALNSPLGRGLLGAALSGLGGAAGAQGQQGTSTSQNRMDPRFDPYMFGDGGYLPTVHNVFQQQLAQGGLNDQQRRGLAMQRQVFENPANMQGYQAIANAGQGLLGRGVAANPYAR